MKDFTKKKIVSEMENLSNWCERVNRASENLATMPGVAGWVKGLFVALGTAAAFIFPMGAFNHFYELAKQTLDGAAAITHALKELAIHFGWTESSMLGGIITLCGLAIVGVASAGLLYLFADWAVKKFQSHKANMQLELLTEAVNEVSEEARFIMRNVEKTTRQDISSLVYSIENVLGAFHITCEIKKGYEFTYTFHKGHERFKGEKELASELAFSHLPNISKLRGILDIPACNDDAFLAMSKNSFVYALQEIGVVNPERFKDAKEEDRANIYRKESDALCFN